MHGAKGEEGYWLKHVAVSEFEMSTRVNTRVMAERRTTNPVRWRQRPSPETPKCK